MAKVLLGLGVILLIAGFIPFFRGPTQDPWSFLWWGLPFILGALIVAFALTRRATRALRIALSVMLVPYILLVGFFAVVVVMRMA